MHRITQHVRSCYERIHGGRATPSGDVPILRGKHLAEHLHYPLDLLSDLPWEAWERFLPCGNPLEVFEPSPGQRILNLGSGIGIDSVAMLRSSPAPLAIVNFDVIPGILAQSRALAKSLRSGTGNPGEEQMSWVCGEGDHLPFGEGLFHWVVMNGVFNLFPDKERLLAEIHRTLAPEGRALLADLMAVADLPDYFQEELDAWAWCMSGACSKHRLHQLIEAAGFQLTLLAQIPMNDELLTPMTLVARKLS